MRACRPAAPEPGNATLRISELDASPDGLTISIQRQQGPDSHLADDGWRRTEAWLPPERVARIKDTLEFQLGPEICDRLAGIATIRLRVKEPDIGVVGTTVVAWPQMLTSGAVDPPSRSHDDTVRLRGRPVAEAPPPPPARPSSRRRNPSRRPSCAAEREPCRAPGRAARQWPRQVGDRGHGLAARGRGVLRLHQLHRAAARSRRGGNAGCAERPGTIGGNARPDVAPRKSVRETVAEYLATNPAPDAMMAKGKEFAQAGEMNAAFLVWRRAAEAGNAPAQLELAAFYDPLETPPKAGFTPDGARAADWYERAALAGNPEAQRKFGLLLAKGGAGLPADQGRAKAWLQQAADQNDAEAKKALETPAQVRVVGGLLFGLLVERRGSCATPATVSPAARSRPRPSATGRSRDGRSPRTDEMSGCLAQRRRASNASRAARWRRVHLLRPATARRVYFPDGSDSATAAPRSSGATTA